MDNINMELRRRGFTLTELMITVAIIVIMSVVAGVNINSRLKLGRLEEAVQTLTSDLNYARSAAMFKGCPIRFIFCMDSLCQTKVTGTGETTSEKLVGTTSTAARYYAILRRSQAGDTSGTCYNASAVTTDGFAQWDFDRRPQLLPSGVAFRNIYTNPDQINDDDWSDSASTVAANSLWFDSEFGREQGNPVQNPNTAVSGELVAFQLVLDNCTDADCPGFFVTITTAGVVSYKKCTMDPTSNRTNNTDLCKKGS